MGNIIDLDELVLLCRDEYAKSYVRDAVACYKGGAYRSCIVATWIAIVFDYIHKLRELSLTGNIEATSILADYERIRSNDDFRASMNFESAVITNAADKFELINPLERIDVERIRDDRNRCAHPSMQSIDEPYHPSAELARVHLRNAVEILLSKEPVQGKSSLTKVMADIDSEYFPSDTKSATEFLSSGLLKRAKATLVRSVLAEIFKRMVDSDNYYARVRYFAGLTAIQSIHGEIFDSFVNTKSNVFFERVTDNRLSVLLHFFSEHGQFFAV